VRELVQAVEDAALSDQIDRRANTQEISPINVLALAWTDLKAARKDGATRIGRYAGGSNPGNVATLA
jgi:hypothetical protein